MAKGIDSGRHKMSTLPYKKYNTFVSLHIIVCYALHVNPSPPYIFKKIYS